MPSDPRKVIPYLNYNESQVTVDSVAGSPGDEGVFVRYADGLLVFMDLGLFIHQASERRFLADSARVAITKKHILVQSLHDEREAICSALVRSFYDYHVEFQLNTLSLDLGREWGKKLYFARMKQGLTQAELAEEAEMQQSAISRIESGAHVPRYDTIDRLAWALRLTPFEIALLGPENIPPPFWGRVGRFRASTGQTAQKDYY